jgi:hypothetical protein
MTRDLRIEKIYYFGKYIYLNSRNIKTNRPSNKLDTKFLGPFKVLEKINSLTFKLKLPKSLRFIMSFTYLNSNFAILLSLKLKI